MCVAVVVVVVALLLLPQAGSGHVHLDVLALDITSSLLQCIDVDCLQSPTSTLTFDEERPAWQLIVVDS